MPQLYPLLDSMAAGELTPRMHLRSGLEVYRNSVKTMLNWISLAQGPAVTRPQFNYKATVPGNYARPFEFEGKGDNTYVVVVSDDGNLYIYDTSGAVIDPTQNLVTNPNFEDGDTGWTANDSGTGTVTFTNGTCQLVGGDSGVNIAQQIAITNQANNHLIYVTQVNTETYNVKVGTSAGDDSIASFTSTPSLGQSFLFVPNAASVWITIECAANNTVTLNSVGVYDTAAQTTITFAHPWNDDAIRGLQEGQPPGETSMYFVVGTTETQQLALDPTTNVWSFGAVVFDGKPAPWTGNNWPGAITFFQNRMWLGGTPNEEETFYGSRTGKFTDFAVPTSNPVADDPLQVQLNNKGGIIWLAGTRNLLIGTNNGEYIATSEAGVLKTGDIQIEQQSAYGSARQSIEEIGNRVVYVSPDGRKVREMGYQWTDESWVSTDLTFFSEHITQQTRVVQSAWAQNPENQLWNAGINGKIVGCTFDKANQLVGWHRHETDGSVQGIAKRRYFGFDQLWITVSRTVQGGTFVYLEAVEEFPEFESGPVLDDVIRADSAIATQTVEVGGQQQITAAHLAGKTVKVLIDGAVHPDVTLDSEGKGFVEYAGTVVRVGLDYPSELVTLPPDSYINVATSTKTLYKGFNKIFVSILSSIKPLINGERQGERLPQTPMNTREPSKTEYMQVGGLGYDLDANITIKMDDPLHCLTIGLFGQMTAGDL